MSRPERSELIQLKAEQGSAGCCPRRRNKYLYKKPQESFFKVDAHAAEGGTSRGMKK